MIVETFEAWRDAARHYLSTNTAPPDVHWQTASPQRALFDQPDHRTPPQSNPPRVPPRFLELARRVACHREPARWEILYRTLWRLTHDERHLLEIATDDDIYSLLQMEKAVRRDIHKMKAFVRFRKVTPHALAPKPASEDIASIPRETPDAAEPPNSAEPREQFIAWHRPDHRIVRLAAPFFARRFKAMDWSILTPDESVHWNRHELIFGPGVPACDAPKGDALEELWRTYYANIFNPARVNPQMMKREMPVRHWPTLPETTLIPELLAKSVRRVDSMLDTVEGYARNAADCFPRGFNLALNRASAAPRSEAIVAEDLSELATAAASCNACDLHCHATQTVFGRGPASARIVLIGEQPGDQEDRAGIPFIGPAGQILDQALAAAGIDRASIYLTNAVKHFKYVPRGKRRLHQKPDAREIAACRPWLEAELSLIRPATIVCLGATAAQTVLGRSFRLSENRGQFHPTPWAAKTLATWHPSAILRAPDPARKETMFSELITDLRKAANDALVSS